MYLDNIDDFLNHYDDIPDPPDYIYYTPKLFFMWAKWAKLYKQPENDIRPFGEYLGPEWMRVKFDNLEDFYIYFKDITEGED